MREIKFRAWDKRIGEMTYLDSIDYEAGSQYFTDDNFELMQYAGLKDKNGKEIYEGDIVRYKTFFYGNEKEHTKEIEWEQWISDDFGEPDCAGYFNISNSMEVIGNIYENPELLEVS